MNIIYYRPSLMDASELSAACKYFKCTNLLSSLQKDDFVIYRYSLFPFPLDQEKEIINIGATPINTFYQHRYVADLGNYYLDLKKFTPETWDRLEDIPEDGPFILKGETNSRKSNWKRDMFALNKKEAIEIHSRLCDDSLIGQQKIYIRRYVPLITYLTGIGGMPITKEFRFFVAYKQIISGAYYWQNYADELDVVPDANEVPQDFLNKIINIVGENINFFVMDVAQTSSGEWILIELNDGSCSGLSMNSPDRLYSNLKSALPLQ